MKNHEFRIDGIDTLTIESLWGKSAYEIADEPEVSRSHVSYQKKRGVKMRPRGSPRKKMKRAAVVL